MTNGSATSGNLSDTLTRFFSSDLQVMGSEVSRTARRIRSIVSGRKSALDYREKEFSILDFGRRGK